MKKQQEWQVISMQPDWMKGRVRSEEYATASKLLAAQKSALAEYALEVNKAASEFREKQQKLEREKEFKLATAMDNPLVFIMNLNVNYLPLDYQIRYVRLGYIQNKDEYEKEDKEIQSKLRELQEIALSQYLDGRFDKSSFPLVM